MRKADVAAGRGSDRQPAAAAGRGLKAPVRKRVRGEKKTQL